MLPGDFIAMKLTGEVTTSSSALSEGVLWDFQNDTLSQDVMNHFDLTNVFIPNINPVFPAHGSLQKEVARIIRLNSRVYR